LNYNTSSLGESAGINFNPVGTPYQGIADSDTTDTYPSLIKGLVYVSGNVTTTNHPTIDGGLIVGGTLSTSSDLDLTYRSTYFDNPPPGFTAPSKIQAGPGTWKKVVN
jgi:hypothetical protein